MNSIKSVGIIGSGEFGKVFSEQLTPEGAEVKIYDSAKKAEIPRNASRVNFKELSESDAIVIAVPFDSYEDIIPKIAKETNPDSLIVDVCSVKVKPTECFNEYGLLSRPNILMTHPLFGPQTSYAGLAGKNVIVTKSKGNLAQELLEDWSKKSLIRLDMSAEDHDIEMAKVHVLPFFIGRALLNMNLGDSLANTNYYSKLLALIDVERHHSLELFNTIQKHNPYATSTRTRFITNLSLLDTEISVDEFNYSNVELKDLQGLRERLDIIDEARTTLLGLRFKVTRQIGNLKALYTLPSTDPIREKEQREQLKKIATDHNVPMDLVLEIQRLITSKVVKEHDQLKEAQNQ